MTDPRARANSPAPHEVLEEFRDVGDGARGRTVAAVTLWPLGGATGIECSSDTVAATAVELPANGGAISILSSGGRMFFALGDEDVEATSADHCIDGERGERLEFLLLDGQTHISIICDTDVTEAALNISGLGVN